MHSHTTRSLVSLRKMVLLGLEIHMLAAHTASASALCSHRALVPTPIGSLSNLAPSNCSLRSSWKHTQKQSEKERQNHNALRNLCSSQSALPTASLREEPAVSLRYHPALETTRSHETTRTPSSQIQVTLSIPPGPALSTAPDV